MCSFHVDTLNCKILILWRWTPCPLILGHSIHHATALVQTASYRLVHCIKLDHHAAITKIEVSYLNVNTYFEIKHSQLTQVMVHVAPKSSSENRPDFIRSSRHVRSLTLHVGAIEHLSGWWSSSVVVRRGVTGGCDITTLYPSHR